ncbi:MAG TPA: Ig-like domain-containing protein [Gemmatimonadaceae bacterium]|nr:Ig-like domain-containing protein [Gemmatimonadaceae bacterium]
MSDLAVQGTTSSSATLSFTQVDDGMGQPASYEIRYAVTPLSWGSAASVASGTCATPVTGGAIGATFSCTVLGLSPSTSYNFQAIAFRGAMGAGATFGGLSNLAAASTLTESAPPPVATTVTVSPSSASVAVGATTPLQATVKDQNGSVMTGQTITWSSNNTGTATVNASGVVAGVAAGSATISAATAGILGTSAITVTAVPVAPIVTTVTVAPTSASVVAGATTPLTATVKDQNGSVMAGQTISWTTSNSAAATVNSSGLVTGLAAGSATITATTSGKSGTSAITVTAVIPVVTTVTVAPTSASVVAGATTPLVATVKDQLGNVMAGQTITWTTNNSAAATVNSSGLVTGVAAGSATITATSSGKTGTSSITVTALSGGGTLLFQEDFENSNLASRGWYDNTGVVLSTTEHVAGSTSSAQYRFLAGATTPTSGGAQRHKFTPSSSFYLSYYVKYSANWVGSGQAYHPHEFYAMSTLDGDYDGPSENFLTVYIEQSYQNGGKPRISVQDNKSVNYGFGALPNNLIAVTEDRSVGGCNGIVEANIFSECFDFGTYWYNDKQLIGPVTFQPSPGPGYKNDWNLVEAYFQLNTVVGGIGQPNGVIQYWFNGALVIDRHDILFRTGAHPTLQFSKFLIAPYIGDGSPVDQSMFVDNLKVLTSR